MTQNLTFEAKDKSLFSDSLTPHLHKQIFADNWLWQSPNFRTIIIFWNAPSWRRQCTSRPWEEILGAQLMMSCGDPQLKSNNSETSTSTISCSTYILSSFSSISAQMLWGRRSSGLAGFLIQRAARGNQVPGLKIMWFIFGSRDVVLHWHNEVDMMTIEILGFFSKWQWWRGLSFH